MLIVKFILKILLVYFEKLMFGGFYLDYLVSFKKELDLWLRVVVGDLNIWWVILSFCFLFW